ncbi:hypothetical protein DOM21_17270 [Bacteriovorax stolpii]|uniref:hypothetical protein n=1 Tax=Bacteriovorax stolpii TaxID=960 RepID=UPI0011596234|nr:hypothetical protein [Bacteriovorax stolpii]QDK43173.1 hypothetical protein DOM21_17270 [Bacteriovorax stolpii]
MNLSYPWIGNKRLDTWFILGPAFYSVIIALFLAQWISDDTSFGLIPWIIFVLLIDVSHVYSSLYKTYLNPLHFNKSKNLFILTPLLSFILSAMIYSFDALYFWRALAYLAVFHFIRQQYGFMRLYSRSDAQNKASQWIDTIFIYSATCFPLIYWHAHLPRNFSWFIANDFFIFIPEWFSSLSVVFYIFITLTFFAKEIRNSFHHPVNMPKIIFMIGTSLSWMTGIVLFNSDLIFTVTNVVSHGIPYFALVWLTGKKELSDNEVLQKNYFRYFFSTYSLPVFLGVLFLCSFIEEGFWAGLIWREHLNFFVPFSSLPHISAHDYLKWLVPLLALPQTTHYILDGFIWKKDNN